MSGNSTCGAPEQQSRACWEGPCPPLCPRAGGERRLGESWSQGECRRWSVWGETEGGLEGWGCTPKPTHPLCVPPPIHSTCTPEGTQCWDIPCVGE